MGSKVYEGLKGEVCSNSIMLGYFKTISVMDITIRENFTKETETMNNNVDQLDLIDIYRTPHQMTIENTFLSSSYGAFFRTDNMLGHKIKFKNTEMTPDIFSYHKRMKSVAEEIWKIHKFMEMKQYALIQPVVQRNHQEIS